LILQPQLEEQELRQSFIAFVPNHSGLQDGNGLSVVVLEHVEEDDRIAAELGHVI